ncbi:glucan endo-1,3-beta-glucosidase-like [Durio zibethinus]|uniref:glucan endo-1,3-beta-D-glucosidase n=1 Tax=Durio zibethinus TaxID=66656 RepID=A0A6P6ABR1_DURZI|nr:glucan endo-1,3-beta-glucosidase-like [Durio zibethinus]
MAFFNARNSKNFLMAVAFLLLGIFMSGLEFTGAQSVGVCYGRIGDNLPSEQQVVDLYRNNGIGKMRIYDPNQATLEALGNFPDIELILGVPNEDIQALATDASVAANWVQGNILSHPPMVNIRYISVGNEIRPEDSAAQFLLPAMQNIYNALASANSAILLQLKVTTSVDATLLGSSYPPSAGSFSDSASSYIIPIIQFLADKGAPLLANIYPYFSYIGDPVNIDLSYALFTSPGVVVQDGAYGYQNLFDAILDAFYSAIEKVGVTNMEVIVSETGWPSDGGTAATIENASTYYQNVINHVKNNGTPKKSGTLIQAYLFAMFDEDQKGPAETERHFGLFSPNMQPKYPISF